MRHRSRLAGVDLVKLLHGVGDFGVLEKIGALRPIFHFLRKAASSTRMNELSVTLATKSIAAFGFQNGVSQILWVENLTVTLAAEWEAVANLKGEHEVSERRAWQLCYVMFVPTVEGQFLETLAIASTSTGIPARLQHFKSR